MRFSWNLEWKFLASHIARGILWLPLLLILYWWIREAHEVYGDEAAIIWLARQYFEVLTSQGFLASLTFNSTYPFLFYLLSSPFVIFAADPVFGGRCFIGITSLLSLLCIHNVVKEATRGALPSLLAVFILVSSAGYIEVSRYYLAEGFLVLVLTAFLFVVTRFLAKPSFRLFLGAITLLACGLLSKFSFLIYAFPIFFASSYVLATDSTLRRDVWEVVLQYRLRLGVLAAFLFSVPLYWYWYQIKVSGAAVSGLQRMISSGHLKAYKTPSEISQQVTNYYFDNYFLQLLLGAILLVSLIGSRDVQFGWAKGINFIAAPSGPKNRAWRMCFIASLIGLTGVPVVLAVIGLGDLPRWHLEYIYFAVAFALLADRLSSASWKVVWYGAVGLISVVVLVNFWISPWLRSIDINYFWADYWGRPSRQAVGSKEIASRIASDFVKRGNPSGELGTFFLYHDHRGPHWGSVQHYLQTLLPNKTKTAAGALKNRPVDLVSLFNADYWIVKEFPREETEDIESIRYQKWYEDNEASLQQLLTPVAIVRGRYATFTILHLERPRVSCAFIRGQVQYLINGTDDPRLIAAYRDVTVADSGIEGCKVSYVSNREVALPLSAPQVQFAKAMPSEIQNLSVARGGECNVEEVNGHLFKESPMHLSVGGLAKIRGWGIIDSKRAMVSSATFARLEHDDGNVYFSNRPAGVVRRPDAVHYFNNSIYEYTGFELNGELSGLPTGNYSLAIVMRSGTIATLCDVGRKVILE
jgi:hypothetical protein